MPVKNKDAFSRFLTRHQSTRRRWSMLPLIKAEDFATVLEECWGEAERLAHSAGYAEAEKRITKLLL